MSRRVSWKVERPWLAPLVPLYAAGVGLRSLGFRLGIERVERLGWPVISVGNLAAGGAGKTPFVIALGKVLTRRGMGVDVLSRGYGRLSSAAERVEAAEGAGGGEGGGAARFGDEPLLMARELGDPVYVGARRVDAGRMAEASGARPGVHLLDDGFQHRQLARDVDIVLVSSRDLQDWMLPAGNLREGLGALRRADVLAVEVGDEEAVARLEARGLGLRARQTVWRFRRGMRVPAASGSVVAFCGIARPGQFFSGLEARGMRLAGRQAFPDHHRFEEKDFARLRDLMRETGATALVTTAKDRARLGETELGVPVLVAGLEIELEDEASAWDWMQEALREPLSWARLGPRKG